MRWRLPAVAAIASTSLAVVVAGVAACSVDCDDARRCGPQVLDEGAAGSAGAGGGGGTDPSVVWAQSFGDAEPQLASGVALAADGGTVVAGSFRGSVTIGATSRTSAGGEDALVFRLDGDGNPLWVKRFGDANLDAAVAVGLDGSGNVYLAGTFAGSIDLGGGAMPSMGGVDVFVAKLTGDGDHVWSKSIGGPGAHDVAALAVAGDGSIALAGSFDEELSTDLGPVASAGASDGYVVCLDPMGGERFARAFGGTGDDAANGVTLDAGGLVYAAGAFRDSVDFGDMVRSSDGAADIFVVALDAGGVTRWSKRYGDPSEQAAHGLAADDSQLVVAGDFTGTVSFGAGAVPSAGGDDVFVMSLDPSDGATRWAVPAGDDADQHASAVRLAGGTALVAGQYAGTLELDGHSVTATGSDGFALSLDVASGSAEWIVAIGSDADAAVLGMDASATNVALAGVFSGSIDLSPVAVLPSGGATDGFVVIFSR
jgi:hypothetical protein